MSKNETAQKDIKFANVKATKYEALTGERKLRVIATAPTLDRDLEVIDSTTIRVPIKPTGWKYLVEMTKDDKPDVPLLLDHEWALKSQAGSLESIFINADGETEAVAKISKVDNGERVYTLAQEDNLGNSFSIGYSLMNATLDEGTWYNIELLELSAVFKGSNRNARLLDVKSVNEEKSMSETDKLKAEIEAKQAELAELETKEVEVVTETPVETAPVEEPAKTEEAVAEPVEEVEAPKVEAKEVETKKASEEAKETKMSKEVETKGIVEAPVAEQVIETKSFDKIDHAAKQFIAYLNKDTKALAELNKQSLETYSGAKATYLNTGVTADGGAIVPSAQLLEDVYSTLSVYSGVANDIRVITLTSGDSLDIATLVDDVIVTEVETEGGAKSVTKPVFGDDNIALREFAGIAIMTKKLVRQAAVNVYDILVQSFARAIARQRAELILTDASSGIVNKAGVTEITTAGALPTYAEITSAPWTVPVAAVQGAKYYISREALGAIATETNTLTGEPINVVTLDGATGLTGRFKNGFQFTVEESLGVNGQPHVVFGAMGRFGILLRQGAVESETFDTGVVTDGSEVEHNLLQQNKLAHRVAFYENAGFPVPSAFAVFVEAGASS